MALLPFRLYIALPLISLLIHLTSENRVYWVHFHHANFGPLLLGILVAVYQRRFIRYSSFILFCMATILLLSIAPEDYQRQLTSRFMGIGISPLRTMLLGSAAVAILLAIRHRSLLAIMSIAGCGTLATMGTNVHEIGSRAIILFRTLLDWSLQIIHGFTPQTPTQWGVLAILGAFAFLAVGAVISLRTAKKIESESVELEPNDLAT